MLPDAQLDAVAPDVLAAYESTVQWFADLGAKVIAFEFGDKPEDYIEKNGIIISYEGWLNHADKIKASNCEMDPGVRKRFMAGETISEAAYVNAVKARQSDQKNAYNTISAVDIIITPTTPITVDQCLQVFDFNDDSDVDLGDFRTFMGLYQPQG